MPHGQPCGACDGSCRMSQRGAPSTSPIIPSLSPSSGGNPSPRSSQRIDSVRVPARLPGGSDHPEYGLPLSPRSLRPYLSRGPGAFCAPPWRPDVNRLAGDVNRLFRGISTSSIHVTEDSRVLRRVLLDFYAMGYTHARPTLECWQALLQLMPEQSLPLRATLRAINSEDKYEQRFLDPPSKPPKTLFGEECEVSGDESPSEEEEASGNSTISEFSPEEESASSDFESFSDEEDDSCCTGKWSSSESDSEADVPTNPPTTRARAAQKRRGRPVPKGGCPAKSARR
ncbi:regulatory protein ICP22 [Equid alphaherpesvirus 4]|nr:regulatory protein ICP22 [Equid alphaherpesvirus 4]BAV93206.1 regulatory protein ICP22 [Equid alphaherpesvirus 4]